MRAFSRGFSPYFHQVVPHADLCKSVMQRGGFKSDNILETKKVKAHLSLEESRRRGIEDVHFWGNHHADRLADLGACLHPPNASDVAVYKTLSKDITSLALHMIDCLQALHLERIDRHGKLPRLPVGVIHDSGNGKSGPDGHSYWWNGKHWICRKCFVRTKSPSFQGSTRGACKGTSFFDSLLLDHQKHTLFSAQVSDGTPILFCKRCWHYASDHPKQLKVECAGEGTVLKPSVKFYLAKGVHPISRLPFSKPLRV